MPSSILGFIRANPQLPETRGYIRRHLHLVLPPETQTHLGTGDNILRWALVEWCKVNLKAPPPAPVRGTVDLNQVFIEHPIEAAPTGPVSIDVEFAIVREFKARRVDGHVATLLIPRDVASQGRNAILDFVSSKVRDGTLNDITEDDELDTGDVEERETISNDVWEWVDYDDIRGALERDGIPFRD